MLSTKKIVLDINKIPSYWIFEYYLNLPEKLTGQDIKIKSIWNTAEKTPSMSIYVCKKTRAYKYKDFSSGKSGDKIELVKQLFNCDYSSAAFRIVSDYNKYADKDNLVKITPQSKWTVDFIKTRDWYKEDADYWLQFRIGQKLLTKYNVKPIEYFNIVKLIDNKTHKNVIKSNYMYGYFDKNNTIIKIYQPRSKKLKFLNVNDYIQGLDQLSYKQPYLVICSSLKDAMCLKSFGYNIDVIAPNSENSLIKPYVIENLKKKYKSIITLFDNDEAGKNAIDKYKSVYNINGFYLPICKDISDAVSQNDFMEIHKHLKPLLIKNLKT
jgi:hypothetical protein|tara:strand:- start:385 stop:1356 length:972 start_codon:yes stop_codon:yes gene_type:complete